MSSKYYEDQLLNAIDTMVDSAVSRADYDKTIRAVVNKCIDQTTGRYEIKYQESIFEAVTNNTDIKYKDGTQVYILVPGNDMRQTKIILHAVDAEGMQDLAIKEISVNSYETIGQNTIEENSFSLKSYLGDDNFTVYDREEGINYIYYDENALQAHIQEAEGLLMGATFKTELTEEQKRGSGNFGVKFEVDFNGTGVDELITREFVIDINHGMMGDPYNFIDEIEQKQNFFMDLTDYNSLRKVTIFAENFPNIDVLKEPDIFFSNFKLQTTRHITEGYSLRIKTDKEYFGKDDNINSKINVTSELCLNGYPLERNSEYYWFKQNNKIDGSDPNWNKYAGAGWKCLNASQDTGSGTKVWDTDEKQLVIKYSDCPALENNYKLIIVLKNNEQTVVEQNFSIRNYNTDFSFEIESDEGTEFSFNNGSPTLTAKFESSEEYNPTKLEYVWTVEDNLGQVKQLPQTIEDNENYNQARDNYYSLLSEIESGEKFANENISKLNEYLTEMKKYDTMQRVERNQIIHVNIQEIDEYSYYCCSIYFEDGLLGSAKIKLTRIMELQGDYTLSIINGNQTFNYSVDGLAPTHSSLEKPIKLEPLAIELIDNKGKKFSDYMLDYCNIKWIAPTNSLIKAQDSSDKTFTYELEDLYNINKIDNSVIKLEVEYQGIVFNAQTNFSFVKDGEPGTNGTGVVCKIVPNTNDNMEFYPTIYYSTFNNEKPYLNFTPINGDKKQAGKWFKVQLWQNGEKIFDGTDSGSGVQITWSILVNRYNASTSDPSAFKIENNIFNFTQYEPNGANILKATIKYNNSIYTCTLPILTMRIDNSDYRINLIKNTGFRYVMYSSDGKSPKYDNATPFKLLVTKWINDKWEDISDNRYPGYQISYHWYIKGRLYNGTSWYDQYNLAGRTNEIGNEGYYVPVESYNGY